MPSESHVGSMRIPCADIGTRKFPRYGSEDWTAADTSAQPNTLEPLENVLRPFSRHPNPLRTAVVAGNPPRLGLPISGSLARLLINAPFFTTDRPTSSSSEAGHKPASRTRP